MAKHDVIAIGSPLVDYLIAIEPSYLDSVSGNKWGMEPVDHDELLALIEQSGSLPEIIPGGSAANVIKGLASLGHKTAFAGKIGNDDTGALLTEQLQAIGIDTFFPTGSRPTGKVACLITPDGRRTCRSFLGASQEMGPGDLPEDLFHGARHAHFEGYALLNDSLLEQGMRMAKAAGATVSFDLGSFEIVEQYRERIITLLKSYVDLVICNKLESKALTGLSPEKTCKWLKDFCKIAIVMIGKEGCWVATGVEKALIPAYPVEPVDTTGAGDLFTAGFLHGFLMDRPLDICARYGALAAREVVQVVGAELSAETWERVKRSFAS